MKEKKELEKKKKKDRKPDKYLLAALGLFLIIISTVLIVFISGYLALRYSPQAREYFVSLLEVGESVVEERRIILSEGESNVVDVVERTSSSVVSIAVSTLSLSPEEGLVDRRSNIGTGFVVDKDGIIITNQHVVSDSNADYKIVTQNGEECDVIEIMRDDLNDIAVIRVDTKGEELEELTLGDSGALLVGQDVIAIGTPLGTFAGSATKGIISGLNRAVTVGVSWFGSTVRTYEDVIQTDAAVNPGNSGGPLLNLQGEVVGINFATTADADNISFAVPINKVKNRLEEYRTYGKFIRPYLGITYQMISEYEALYYTDVVPGALVLRVDPTSPAFEAGLKRGDILIRFGEDQVDRFFGEIIQEYGVGEEVEVEILRDGKEETLTVVLGEMD
jgi:serine protease Do